MPFSTDMKNLIKKIDCLVYKGVDLVQPVDEFTHLYRHYVTQTKNIDDLHCVDRKVCHYVMQ